MIRRTATFPIGLDVVRRIGVATPDPPPPNWTTMTIGITTDDVKRALHRRVISEEEARAMLRAIAAK